MQRWEYMTMSFNSHYGRTDFYINGRKNVDLKDKVPADVMNILGDKGWEMVAVMGEKGEEFIFKRAKGNASAGQAAPPQEARAKQAAAAEQAVAGSTTPPTPKTPQKPTPIKRER